MSSFFGKIKNAIFSTSSKISTGITSIFLNRKLDESTIEELEELLISADMGVKTASHIISEIKKIKFEKDIEVVEVQAKIADIVNEILSRNHRPFTLENGLNIILVCGVNGNGKTTSIGKLASSFKKDGKKIVIAACDTFRAAAISQLEVWAERADVDFVAGEPNSDPASAAFKAVKYAQENNADILMIDTAGRLQNQQNLMAELSKIKKVIENAAGFPPQHNILVLDATTGQNALSQAEAFTKIAGINGLIITKLDGTAKAGVVVSLSELYKIPIYFVGLGEGVEDLKAFESKAFANALVGIES
ncbi:MAG UNVERIFIED_CONTAM: signal recognition particle-docking protein FtsY [Rickettsiaceae bacterium]|jgi:fused signal recognition particle receptor